MSLKSSAKAYRIDPSFDRQFEAPVCGIDEVGRGPLAGPVVAACVFIPQDKLELSFWCDVQDSKKIPPNKREVLAAEILQNVICGIAEATPEEIDSLNIHHATLLAMKRAFNAIEGVKIKSALVDGRFAPQISCATRTLIKGDATSLSIAAASIVAKVRRDALMARLHAEYPAYGWVNNAGYGTPEHLAAIATRGITVHHRQSFAPCAQKAFAF